MSEQGHDIPTEKPDPVTDYEGYKRWRAAQKGAKAAPAAAVAAPAAAPAAEAPAAAAPAAEPKADTAAGVWPPPDRPNPITDYAAYKTWKAAWKAKKGGKPAPAPAAAAGASGPRKKVQPHAAKLKGKGPSRRSALLGLGGFMWLLFTGAMGFFTTLLVRFLFPNVLYEKPTSFKIGFPGDFLPNGVDERFLQSRQIWVNRDETKIYVLKAVCTHLGCTPAWQSGDRKFKCPCHGSGFRFTGMNFEGPAPRPLERFRVYLADDGQIVVDTTKVFLQEGQWVDPEASIPA